MNAKRCILLSGTPLLNRPAELYNIFKMIRPDIFYNFLDYGNRYCDPQARSFGMDYTGSSCTKELNYILNKHFMIRRLKIDVLVQLPPKRK